MEIREFPIPLTETPAPRQANRRQLLALAIAVACAASVAPSLAAAAAQPVAAQPVAAPPKLAVDQILSRHIAARGGLGAWQAVQTMTWSGKMDAGTGDSLARSERIARSGVSSSKKLELAATQAGEPASAAEKQVQLPFVLKMKRPAASRLELEFAGKTAVQIYNGQAGWKLRPYLNRDDWEPFSAEELKASAGKWQLDGPLLDAAANGTKVEADGADPVDGKPAYRLKLTTRQGAVSHIWIDAKSFLDVKVEGPQRRMDGRMHNVYTLQRDFHSAQGVIVPYELDTIVDGYPDVHKTLIEKVTVNAPLGDDLFTRPAAKTS
jgi:hypothetical protein